MSKEVDSQTVAKVDLNRTGSGPQIPDAQQQINDNKDDIATNRADIDSNDVELSDHESRISQNETDIANIQGDYVDLSTNQTVGGEKTFSANGEFSANLTVQGDLTVNGTTTTVNTSTLDVADQNITVNNGGSDATAEGAGLTVERVGTDGSLVYEDALDMKWKAGALGSEKELHGVIKDTEANILATGSPLTSVRYYATDTGNSFFYDSVSASFKQVGSGEGGGGLDVFHTETFESTVAADFTTGNSVTFLDGGATALVGTLSDETTSPIAGASSLKYTSAAASINDWLASPAFDLDPKQRGNDASITFYHTQSGLNSEYEVVVWDVDNAQKLNSSLDVINVTSNRTRFSTAFFIPATCTQLRWGLQSIQENGSGPEVVLDDVEFSVNPFLEARLDNITDFSTPETLTINGTTSAPTKGTTSVDEISVRQVGTEGEIKINFLQTSAGTAGSGDYLFTLPNGKSFASSVVFYTGTSNYYDADKYPGIEVVASNTVGTLTAVPYDANTFRLFIGPATVDAGGGSAASMEFMGSSRFTLSNTDVSLKGRFTAPIDGYTATSTHIITPAKSNLTDWQSYTPTFGAGLGTVSNVSAEWRRVGDTLEARGFGTTSGVTTSDGAISIPSGLTIDDNKIGRVSSLGTSGQSVGVWGSNSANAMGHIVTATTTSTNDVYISGNVSTSKIIVSSNSISTESLPAADFSWHFKVPIAEWTSDVTFLAAVPVQKVAIFSQKEVSGTASGSFSSGSYQTRVLNTVEGSVGLGTLLANQITLPRGQYVVDAIGPCKDVNTNRLRFQNITDGITEILGGAFFTGNTETALLAGYFEINSTKTFELQHKCSTTRLTDGFGGTGGYAGEDEVYAVVKITKLR